MARPEKETIEKHKAEKLILMGDFNARNPSSGGLSLTNEEKN